jgi:hypothetical protein
VHFHEHAHASYARQDKPGHEGPDMLGPDELAFIASRDSFYMASVTPEGWPYVQHRGGPAGFLRHIAGNRIGFADYRGNKQYISRANFAHDDRVSLFLIDYPRRARLKMIGRARTVEVSEDPDLVRSLAPEGYRAVPERAILIDVAGFDWNCPQHITPRFTQAEIHESIAPLMAELEHLRAEVKRLGGALPGPTQGDMS